MERPKRLYKYVTAARTDVLRDLSLRFTQPSALNDPFELTPMFEQVMSEEKYGDTLEQSKGLIEDALREQYKKLPAELRSRIPLENFISIVQANPSLVDHALSNVAPTFRAVIAAFAPQAKAMLAEAIQSKVGILSLSESADHPLLWAHYADSHKGLAIEFDVQHEYFDRRRSDKDELYHLRQVKYAERSSMGRTLFDLDGDDLLVTKTLSWSYEREWRMLAPLDAAESCRKINGEAVYLFSVPALAITGVVLGARVADKVADEVAELLRLEHFRHTQLYRAELDMNRQVVAIKKPTRSGGV